MPQFIRSWGLKHLFSEAGSGKKRKVSEAWRDPSNLTKSSWPAIRTMEQPRLFTLLA